jgi:DNA-binding MarR family transcriptional regulator
MMEIVQASRELHLKGALFQRAARQLLRLRQERKRQFQTIEIVGPAWPLMLALYGFDSLAGPPSVGDLANHADLPRSTALRWLRLLQRHGLVVLAIDPADRRVVRVQLTPEGRRGMHETFVATATDSRQSSASRN